MSRNLEINILDNITNLVFKIFQIKKKIKIKQQINKFGKDIRHFLKS